jgi:hypothetical protein
MIRKGDPVIELIHKVEPRFTAKVIARALNLSERHVKRYLAAGFPERRRAQLCEWLDRRIAVRRNELSEARNQLETIMEATR